MHRHKREVSGSVSREWQSGQFDILGYSRSLLAFLKAIIRMTLATRYLDFETLIATQVQGSSLGWISMSKSIRSFPFFFVLLLAVVSLLRPSLTEVFFFYTTPFCFLLLVGAFVFLSLREFAAPLSSVFWKERKLDFLLALIATLLLAFALSADLRIQSDESVNANISLGFWLLKKPFEVQALLYQNTIPAIYEYGFPVRPLLLPYLASLLHGLWGFSVANLYLINLVAVFGFFYVVLRFFHNRSIFEKSGVLFLVLAQPLFAFSFRSAGLEALFVSLLFVNFYCFERLLKTRQERYGIFYALSFIVCLHSRYEALLPLLFPLGYLLYKNRSRAIPLFQKYSIHGALCIVGVLPYVWQRILAKGELTNTFTAYTGTLKPKILGAFHPSYLGANVKSLFTALFDNGHMQLLSPWIVALFFVALTGIFLRKKLRNLEASHSVIIAALGAHFVFFLFYVAGEATDPVTARLFLASFVGLSIASAILCLHFVKGLHFFVLAFVLFLSGAREWHTNNYNRAGYYAKMLDFVHDEYRRHDLGTDDLLISAITAPFIATKLSAFSTQFAFADPRRIKTLQAQSSVRKILYLDAIRFDAQGDTVLNPFPPGSPFQAELLSTRSMDSVSKGRLWLLK